MRIHDCISFCVYVSIIICILFIYIVWFVWYRLSDTLLTTTSVISSPLFCCPCCRYFASTLLSLHLNYIMPSTMESSGTIIHFMHVMISTSVALSVFALASIVVLGCENLAGSSGENVSIGKIRLVRRNMARSKITNNLSWTTTERYKWTRKSICIEWIKCSAYE